ncbi:MAG: hypothetical protein JXA74_06910 [Anaerolineae bacterium]|nr:hypothetical protein [Anaerolineae bacterium]
MQDRHSSTRPSAARLLASLCGVLAGIGGLSHGVGEVLQGNVAPQGLVINSWTVGPIARNMGGDPGMTIIPNFLVTGIVCMLVSLALIVWSVAFVHRRRGALIQLALVIAMLLVGGGFGPPMLGILAGVAGLGINAPLTGWRRRLSAKAQRSLARAWPHVFGVYAANGIFLVIGHLILVFLSDFKIPELFVYSLFFAVLAFPLALLSGVAYDLEGRGAAERL